GIVISGFPGSSFEWASNAIWLFFSSSCTNLSGAVFFPLMEAIIRDLVERSTISAMLLIPYKIDKAGEVLSVTLRIKPMQGGWHDRLNLGICHLGKLTFRDTGLEG